MNLTEPKHGRASHSETTLFFLPVQSEREVKDEVTVCLSEQSAFYTCFHYLCCESAGC